MADKVAELNITRKRVDELISHPLNPRFHPNSQIDKIVDWLSKVGYYKSIVTQKGTNHILAGHGVLAALKADNYTHVDVNEVDQPDKWAMALLAWDNKSGELSTWDQVNLIALEAELHDMDVEMESMGFEMGEIDSMGSNAVTEEDEPPPVSEEEPITQTGDLWILNNHRVLCGDSTVKEDVERVMDGAKADMVFTDPPYGLGDKKSFNDDHPDYTDEDAFDLRLLDIAEYEWVIWGGNYYEPLPMPRNEIGWIVWDKRPSRDGWDDEKRDSADRIFGQHFEIAVTNISELRGKMLRKTWGGYYGTAGHPEDTIVHKTQKPIELVSICIQARHQNILDFFLGSGTTLIAADQLGRKCYGIEIAPKYCDVIAKRYINHAGTSEDVYVEREGQKKTWDELWSRRNLRD